MSYFLKECLWFLLEQMPTMLILSGNSFMNFLKNTEDAHTEDQIALELRKDLFTTTRPSDQCGKLVLPPCGGLPASVTAVMDASGQSQPEAKLLQWCRFAQMNEAARPSSWVLKRRLITKGCHGGCVPRAADTRELTQSICPGSNTHSRRQGTLQSLDVHSV